MLEQQRQSARALLNALLGRAPDAALGPAPEPTMVELESAASVEKRPDVLIASLSIERDKASAEAARAEAHWPVVMAARRATSARSLRVVERVRLASA